MVRKLVRLSMAMEAISALPHHLDKKQNECQAIIETPKGRRNKFKYEPDSGLFSLSKVLPQGFSFPFDFGFIPSTAAPDGDPLDIIVLMDEPAHVGCLLKVRIVGVIRVDQTEKGKTTQNDRVLAVAAQSFDYQDIQAISDLNKALVQQVTEFLSLYNKNSGKHDEVKGVDGPKEALEVVKSAIGRFQQKKKGGSQGA